MNSGILLSLLTRQRVMLRSRPPVGSHVVVAKFELLKYVQLLDLRRSG